MAFASPDNCSNGRCGAKFSKNVEQLLVHVVREGVSLLLVVGGDDGDWAINLESDLSTHGSPWQRASRRSLADSADPGEQVETFVGVSHT